MTRAVIAKALRAPALLLCGALSVACATDSGFKSANSELAVAASTSAVATASASRGREKAIASYRDYLARYPDSPEYDSVSRRLADLLLEQAADLQLAAATTPDDAVRLEAEAGQAYRLAISHYEYLLGQDPQGPQSTAVLYQLARAYQEIGASLQALAAIDRLLASQPDTDTRLYADTRFRRGELLFGEGAYRDAGLDYQAVLDLGESVPAYEQSLYKLGWCLFKQERYPEALPVLFRFLEREISPDAGFDTQLAALGTADRELVTDLFRVIGRSFAQLGGLDAVDRYFLRNGSRNYEQPVYLALGDWYEEQEQVGEAARTWQALAQADPLGAEAPRLIARAIALYRQAGFQQRVVELEILLLQSYGLGSDFWMLHSPADYPLVMSLLQSSLQHLAGLSHGQARSSGEAEAVREAEHWYRQYLVSFGDEAAAPEMNYQLAELLYEYGQYRQALDEYERTAWSRGDHSRAADAALGALHASEKILQTATAKEQVEFTERATAGALR
ncbi:MAG: tetratricopeptide repeat protein, partial [Halioglobus sp.]